MKDLFEEIFQRMYDKMLTAQRQHLYELWHKAELLKGKKSQDTSKKLVAWVTMLEAKTDNSSDESLFPDKNANLIQKWSIPWQKGK